MISISPAKLYGRAHSIFPPLLNNILKRHEAIIKEDMNVSSTVNKKNYNFNFFGWGMIFEIQISKNSTRGNGSSNGIK